MYVYTVRKLSALQVKLQSSPVVENRQSDAGAGGPVMVPHHYLHPWRKDLLVLQSS